MWIILPFHYICSLNILTVCLICKAIFAFFISFSLCLRMKIITMAQAIRISLVQFFPCCGSPTFLHIVTTEWREILGVAIPTHLDCANVGKIALVFAFFKKALIISLNVGKLLPTCKNLGYTSTKDVTWIWLEKEFLVY